MPHRRGAPPPAANNRLWDQSFSMSPASASSAMDRSAAIATIADLQSAMRQNIEAVIERGDRLDTLAERSTELSVSSHVFMSKSRRLSGGGVVQAVAGAIAAPFIAVGRLFSGRSESESAAPEDKKRASSRRSSAADADALHRTVAGGGAAAPAAGDTAPAAVSLTEFVTQSAAAPGVASAAPATSPPRSPGAPAVAAMSPPRTAGAAGAGAAGGVGNAIQQIARLQVRCFLLP